MKDDTKVFFKYLFKSELMPKIFIHNPAFYEIILICILLYSVFFTNISLQSKSFYDYIVFNISCFNKGKGII